MATILTLEVTTPRGLALRTETDYVQAPSVEGELTATLCTWEGTVDGAFTATFWGVFAANGIFLPLGNKLAVMSAVEIAQKRLIAEGVLSIQSGANPRLLDDMLRSSLPPSERGDADKKSA